MASTTTPTSGSTFQFTGAMSGLDTQSIINALMAAERAPLTAITNERTSLNATRDAYEQLRTLLTTFRSAATAFTIGGMAGARLAASSNTSVLNATANSGAIAGTYLVQVNHLATSTRATSTASIGSAITNADMGSLMSSLQLPGTVTAGTMGIVVDGTIVNATIGAAGTTTLGDATSAIAEAVQAQIRAAEGTSNATVTANIVNNHLELSVSGAATAHTLSFGVGGDSTNAAALFGLSSVSGATLSDATPVTGTSALGVVRTSSTLDAAGLASLTSTTTGVMTVNGAAIAYDTATDTLSSIVTKINNSTAGVTASLDRANDRLVLTSKSGGATPLSIVDTSGNLAAALNLAPGTTAAQTLGSQAQVTVDGTSYLSNSNTVTTAIDGVKLVLTAEGSSTVTVTPDATATSNAAKALVDSYNALADALDKLTANPVGGTKGALTGAFGVRDMALSFRSVITAQLSAVASMSSLADLGISTGKIGSTAGSTNRLQFDAKKLQSALDTNPSAVSDLLTSAMTPLITSINAWTDAEGNIDTAEKGIASRLTDLSKRETDVNERITVRQAALEAKFAAMEALLAQMQTTTASLNNTIAQQNKNTG